jgi:2'-5' RNA ligase
MDDEEAEAFLAGEMDEVDLLPEQADNSGYDQADAEAFLLGYPTRGALLSSLTAAAQSHDSAMIAVVPAKESADQFAVADYEPAEELHVTLLYLGPADLIADEQRDAIITAVAGMIEQREITPFISQAFSVNVFNPGNPGKDTCIVAGISGRQIPLLREMMREALYDGGAMLDIPEQHVPFVPHMTLAYTSDPALITTLLNRTGPITFDRVRVAFAGSATDIPLGGGDD